jgi:hypothetical protein
LCTEQGDELFPILEGKVRLTDVASGTSVGPESAPPNTLSDGLVWPRDNPFDRQRNTCSLHSLPASTAPQPREHKSLEAPICDRGLTREMTQPALSSKRDTHPRLQYAGVTAGCVCDGIAEHHQHRTNIQPQVLS